MPNNIREARSNSALVPTIEDPLRILRYQDLAFRSVYSHENPECAGSIKQEPIHTLDQAFSSLDRKRSTPSHMSQAQSASAAIIADVESSRKFVNVIDK